MENADLLDAQNLLQQSRDRLPDETGKVQAGNRATGMSYRPIFPTF
jgi:hypothetical protein